MSTLRKLRLGDYMKIKLINKDNPVPYMYAFKIAGADMALTDQINSGKEVEVDKIPSPASEYVEEIKEEIKPIKKNGKAPKGDK